MHNPETPTESLLEHALKLGLTESEYDRIVELMQRHPNFTELSVFSVMWSEHCSYKHSIKWLKKLPRDGRHVLAAAGEENAGLLDIGDGWAVCFKIESHNHPSAIEPYQGAATGVGGIHRDIMTMGARPVAALNSLRFGPLDHPRTQHLLRGVVRGIGDYGNAFGVPTVGGEVYFEACYLSNPLVNAMSVGVVRTDSVVHARADGPGNPVYIVGSATGRDGIHGASFASQDLNADSADQIPAVQVGDPFQEKILLEATMEVLQTGAVVGMQDMGAAGIACSSSEMSAKSETGMDLWLDRVHFRQGGMQPFEILLSESQERMLIVVQKGREREVEAVFDKWELPCNHIGQVTDTGRVRYYFQQELTADIPSHFLVLGGETPVYDPPTQLPGYLSAIEAFDPHALPEPEQMQTTLERLIVHPNIASRRWITRQYDSTVGAATMSTYTPSDAAVVAVRGTEKALAMSVDCNARYVHAFPKSGTALAVAEAARNLVCSGARPIGITNCLNFGSPKNPEIYWQFTQAILGMKEACEVFQLPVTGGNVSFYNQTEDQGAVYPTPTIGMVGLLEHAARDRMTLDFRHGDDLIYLLGTPQPLLTGSVYLHHLMGVALAPCPHVDLDDEYQLQNSLLTLIQERWIQSAHDVSEGGLLVALLESAMPRNLGFAVENPTSLRPDVFWFNEDGGRVVVSTSPESRSEFEDRLNSLELPFLLLGTVLHHSVIEVNGANLGQTGHYLKRYESALEDKLNQAGTP